MSHLLTPAQRRQLLANGQRSAAGRSIDPYPVVKLFLADGRATWLLTELARLRGYLKLSVSRDVVFQANRPLSVYAAEAIAAGRITV